VVGGMELGGIEGEEVWEIGGGERGGVRVRKGGRGRIIFSSPVVCF
jgi:hypothetical protein